MKDEEDSPTFQQDFKLSYPPLNATDIHPGFEFEWTKSEVAVSYELHIGESFDANDLMIKDITTTTYVVDGLKYGRTYFWKIIGINASGQRAESLPFSFDTKTNWKILDEGFAAPQLSTTKTVWIYLPPDYDEKKKDYPVLYMFDGFWLFGKLTNTTQVTWEIDEKLDDLYLSTGFSIIVVGIDNAQDRDNELSPWVSQGTIDPTSAGFGGKGDEYMQFIIHSLKPFIDARFRTLPDKSTTGIMGASLGGLMSCYAIFQHHDVFGRAGIFSPSFWYADENMYDLARKNLNLLEGHKMYFMAGSTDLNQIKLDLERMVGFLDEMGYEDYTSRIYPGGHVIRTWGGVFTEAVQWLFQVE